ncbi:hypothetical protein DFH08DRAFT_842936 [Mycena albidolilacea]|uniref:Uncharacterized protein n=1 Tax=Mycena albidolilacea TaxID=1033008 RepID=A0AAD7AK21_9AGAR|nr:hypothetical protein DFH08DRAFT_842936 [Mycena albidolilacea]
MANTPPPTNAQGTLPSPISTQHAEVSSATLSPVSQSPPPEPAPLSRPVLCVLAVVTLFPVGTLARLELLLFRLVLLVGVATMDHKVENRTIYFSGTFLATLIFWGFSWAEFGYLSTGGGVVLGVLAFYFTALHRRRIEDLGILGAPLLFLVSFCRRMLLLWTNVVCRKTPPPPPPYPPPYLGKPSA